MQWPRSYRLILLHVVKSLSALPSHRPAHFSSAPLVPFQSLLQHVCLTWSTRGASTGLARSKNFPLVVNLSFKHKMINRFLSIGYNHSLTISITLTIWIGDGFVSYLQRPRVYARSGRDAPVPEHRGVGRETCGDGFLLRYSHKNRNFGRVFALLTEKSQNVCSRRVESVCMGEGGRLERGCGAAKSKSQWHWSESHIVLDKDAAQRAAGAPPVRLKLTGETRTRSDPQVSYAATMLVPSCTLLLLAALHCADLTKAEVSPRLSIDSFVRGIITHVCRKLLWEKCAGLLPAELDMTLGVGHPGKNMHECSP